MKDGPGDLDRLPDMSPGDDRVVPSSPGRMRGRSRLDRRTVIILCGIALILGCGALLLGVFAFW